MLWTRIHPADQCRAAASRKLRQYFPASPRPARPRFFHLPLSSNRHNRLSLTMETETATPQVALAELSCISCRRLKRRCTKDLPKCSLCSRVGRACEYPTPDATPDRQGAPRPDRPDSNTSSYFGSPGSVPDLGITARPLPAAFFVDSVASRGTKAPLSNDLLWDHVVSEPAALSTAQAEQVADTYFASTHQWLPIVSRPRWNRQLQAGNPVSSANRMAMVYAMLLASNQETPVAQGLVHRAIKIVLAACEAHGQITISLLTAHILVSLYEIGRTIFPSAYLSVGHCAKLCLAMGLHDKRNATQLLPKADTWNEVEERRRLWWAVLLLDRFLHLGFRFRPLSVPAIPPDEIIPANDAAWDRGEVAVNHLLVMSLTTSASVGPYARLCQAAHLLGRVCQHVNEHPSSDDADFHFQEAWQISKAARALLALLKDDSSNTNSPEHLFTSRAICYSTLLLLYDVHCCIEVDEIESCGGNRGLRLDLQQAALEGMKEMSLEVHQLGTEIEQFVTSSMQGVSRLSPLVLNCLYFAASNFAWFVRENGNEEGMQCLNDLRRVLDTFRPTWEISGELSSSNRW